MRVTSAAAAAAVEPLSSHPDLLKHFSFDWTRAREEIKNPVAGIRPLSSLIRGRVYKSLKRLWPADTSTRRDCEDAAGSLKTPQSSRGSSIIFFSVQGMKPNVWVSFPAQKEKFAYISCGKQRKQKGGGKHFGEHFKLAMCLFHGLACLALNKIQSVFRQHQIKHN